jgi:hypothetical protein
MTGDSIPNRLKSWFLPFVIAWLLLISGTMSQRCSRLKPPCVPSVANLPGLTAGATAQYLSTAAMLWCMSSAPAS